MRAADRLHSRLGKAEALDLACLNQVLYSARHVFDLNRRIDAVLIVEIDGTDLEPLERTVGTLLDALRPAIYKLLSAGIDFDPEFRGYHHFALERSEGFADELFIRER